MKTAISLLCVALLAATAAAAAPEAASWPPTPEVRDRMRELQATLQDPAVTHETRRAARAELIKLLRSPDAAPVDPDKPRAARASVPALPDQSPLPATSSPVQVPRPPMATLVPAPRAIPPFTDPPPFANPQNGRILVPSGRAVVDPVTGRVLPEVPGGYVDPRTGRLVPGR